MDLAELQESVGAGSSRPHAQGKDSPVWDDALRLANLYDRIYTCPKPTIAAVNGAAVAGGAGLVSVCDLAVAVAGGAVRLPGGPARPGGGDGDAAPAAPRRRTHGPLSAADRRADRRRGGVAGGVRQRRGAGRAADGNGPCGGRVPWRKGGPNALARTKELLRQFSRQAVSVEEAAKASAAPRLTEECRQGLEAFFAKRPAPWAPE